MIAPLNQPGGRADVSRGAPEATNLQRGTTPERRSSRASPAQVPGAGNPLLMMK